MITSLSIEKLRGIRQGTLNPFTQLVVLVGRNGAGKSTVLDALYLATYHSPETELYDASHWMLWRDGEDGSTKVSVVDEKGVCRDVALRCEIAGSVRQVIVEAQSTQRFPAGYCIFAEFPLKEYHFFRALHDHVVKAGKIEETRKYLKHLIPGPKENVPIFPASSGISSLAGIIFALVAQSKGGAVLLEEPEIHQHPSALGEIARAILDATRRGVQVILSTHSLELIDHIVNQSSEQDLTRTTLFRLLIDDQGQLQSSRLSGQDVALARREIGDDIR